MLEWVRVGFSIFKKGKISKMVASCLLFSACCEPEKESWGKTRDEGKI